MPDYRQASLVGPDSDPARAGGIEQAAGAFGLAAGVPASLAVQHDQQRAAALAGSPGLEGGGEPARPQPDHQVRLPRPGGADDDHVPGTRRCGQGEHGVPAVPDGADGAADRDQAATGEQRDGAGGFGQAQGGAGLPVPLAGVEDDRGRGGDAAQAGGDGVDPPRPQHPAQRQAAGQRHRGQQQERPGQRHRGQVAPAVRPGPAGSQERRAPARGADFQGGQPGEGGRERPGGGPVQPDRGPAAQPRRQVPGARHHGHRPGGDHGRGQQQPPGQLDGLAQKPQEDGELQPGPRAHRCCSGVNAATGRSRTTTRACSPGGTDPAARVTTGRALGAVR